MDILDWVKQQDSKKAPPAGSPEPVGISPQAKRFMKEGAKPSKLRMLGSSLMDTLGDKENQIVDYLVNNPDHNLSILNQIERGGSNTPLESLSTLSGNFAAPIYHPIESIRNLVNDLWQGTKLAGGAVGSAILGDPKQLEDILREYGNEAINFTQHPIDSIAAHPYIALSNLIPFNPAGDVEGGMNALQKIARAGHTIAPQNIAMKALTNKTTKAFGKRMFDVAKNMVVPQSNPIHDIFEGAGEATSKPFPYMATSPSNIGRSVIYEIAHKTGDIPYIAKEAVRRLNAYKQGLVDKAKAIGEDDIPTEAELRANYSYGDTNLPLTDKAKEILSTPYGKGVLSRANESMNITKNEPKKINIDEDLTPEELYAIASANDVDKFYPAHRTSETALKNIRAASKALREEIHSNNPALQESSRAYAAGMDAIRKKRDTIDKIRNIETLANSKNEHGIKELDPLIAQAKDFLANEKLGRASNRSFKEFKGFLPFNAEIIPPVLNRKITVIKHMTRGLSKEEKNRQMIDLVDAMMNHEDYEDMQNAIKAGENMPKTTVKTIWGHISPAKKYAIPLGKIVLKAADSYPIAMDLLSPLGRIAAEQEEQKEKEQ